MPAKRKTGEKQVEKHITEKKARVGGFARRKLYRGRGERIRNSGRQ